MSIAIDAAKLMKSIEAEHGIKVNVVRLSWAPDDGSGEGKAQVNVVAEAPVLERIDCTIGFTS